MSLLPIIYNSLLIFVSLLTTVIIISYILYKVRSKNILPVSEKLPSIPTTNVLPSREKKYRAEKTQHAYQYKSIKNEPVKPIKKYIKPVEKRKPSSAFKRYEILDNGNSSSQFNSTYTYNNNSVKSNTHTSYQKYNSRTSHPVNNTTRMNGGTIAVDRAKLSVDDIFNFYADF
ncbi:MAG: hypothetical protein K9J16_06760 [Melioribacteraceae bacterium]|nr:hypothetical protein [Melioribacteraceae bacterium]MCF8356812.1 hypothetical protein [Melioribacteraceae bacterium]MCF8394263.1 hypothetical protein [Melioribacteraceae bacterium]MCF8418163.1 hypothetical protein [Melioribacteraceae bacterium]